MAVLPSADLTKLRNLCEPKFSPVNYTKPQINAVMQAIEDTLMTRAIIAGDVGKTVQQLVSTAIDAASPISFSAAQKKILFALWAELRFEKDSV
jgi:hypothetical protein